MFEITARVKPDSLIIAGSHTCPTPTTRTFLQLFTSAKLLRGEALRQVNRLVDLRSEGAPRRGNMGHLTRIANMVVQNLEKGPEPSQIIDLIKGKRRCAGCQVAFPVK